jgi:hypothetical protein
MAANQFKLLVLLMAAALPPNSHCIGCQPQTSRDTYDENQVCWSPKSVLKHPSRVRAIAISPDGRYMATTFGSFKVLCSIWDIARENKLREVGFPLAIGEAILFLPKSPNIIIARQFLQICDYTSGDNVYLDRHGFAGLAKSMAYSSKKNYVAVAGLNSAHNVLLFDPSLRKEVGRFSVPFSLSLSVTLSSDGISCAVAGGDPGMPYGIFVWDVEKKTEIFRIDGKYEVFRCILFLPNKSFLVSGSNSGDTSLKLWKITQSRPAFTFPCQQKGVACIALSPDGRSLPTDLGSFEGTLLLAEGKKVRMEINKSKDDGLQLTPEAAKKYGKMRLRIVSDGVHQMMEGNGLDRPQLCDTPKNLNADILTWMSRTGLVLPQAPLPDQKVDAAKDRFVVSDFRLGIREKIGERDTQRLEYQLSPKGIDIRMPVVVWIDIRTLLPVKRTVKSLNDEQRKPLTENYTKLILDEKIDSKKFELPK